MSTLVDRPSAYESSNSSSNNGGALNIRITHYNRNDLAGPKTPDALGSTAGRDRDGDSRQSHSNAERTPTQARMDAGQEASFRSKLSDEDGHLVEHEVDSTVAAPGNSSGDTSGELRPEDAVDSREQPANISASSSPEVDFDKPLTNRISAALQRGDSTSSDSSTSGLSRASSSSSVYATPFRMTPMRPGAGTPSRPGSYVGSRADSYFNLVPNRYPQRGAGYASARSSFSGPAGIPSSRVAGPSVTSTAANGLLLPTAVPPPVPESPPGTPAAQHVQSAPGLSAAGHRSQGSNATIGPATNLLAPGMVPLVSSQSHPSPLEAPTDGLTATSPPRPVASTSAASPPSQAYIGTSSPESIRSNLPTLRLPPTPGVDYFLASGMNGPQTPGALPRVPIRPGLGSRQGSAVSLSQMHHKKITDFELAESIGQGSYSTVHLATDKSPPHRRYAIKELDKRHIIRERKVKYVNVEKVTLARLDRHPGIIRLYWTFHDDHSLYFVLELAENGEILKYLKDYGSFQVDIARFYAAQILSAVEHMHKRGIVHRDLKPENILLDTRMRVKIADFGTAKILSTSPTTERVPAEDVMQSRSNSFVGTAQYVCPELLTLKTIPDPAKDPEGAIRALPPPHAADFWAIGCILFQFIAGYTPFRAPNEYLIFKKITSLDYDFPEDFPGDAKDLIRKLLVLDPEKRLGTVNGVKDLMDHPFFRGTDWSSLWTVDPPPFQTGIAQPTPQVTAILALEESSIDEHETSDEDGEPETASLSPPNGSHPGPHSDVRSRDSADRQSISDRPSIPWAPRELFHAASSQSAQRTSSSSPRVDSERPSSRSTNGSWQMSSSLEHSRSRSSSQGRWSKFFSLPRSAIQRMKNVPARRRSLSKSG